MNEYSDIDNLFLKEKPSMIVTTLARRDRLNARTISEEVETTYSHAVRVLNRMEELNVVKSERNGRNKNYELTTQGERISEGLKDTFPSLHLEKELERNL